MPYQREWLIENQVLYIKLWGEQTVEDLQQLNREILALLHEVNWHPIHVVTDASALEERSVSIFEMRKYLTYTHHQNLGWTISFGMREQSIAAATKNFVLTRLAKLSQMRYVRVGTFDEAIAYLLNVDSLLDWDKVNANVQTLTPTT